MRHIVTLKNNREFGKVYNQKESFANKYLVMYLRANNLDYSRIGISVSKNSAFLHLAKKHEILMQDTVPEVME